MKNKAWIGVASFFVSMSLVILVALVFFGDQIDSLDAKFYETQTQTTIEETTKETTTVVTTTEPETETTTEIETTTIISQRPAYSGNDEKLVAFTFDDGPSPTITPQILDLLERYDSRATFFVLGNMVSGKDYIFDRMISLGCEIGNHSNSHRDFEELEEDEIKADFEASQRIIRSVSGVEPELFRVPYGDRTPKILSSIDAPLVYWSIDTLDWDKKDKPDVVRTEEQRNADIKKIYDGVINYVQPGDIVLMHDLYQITVDAFEDIIETLTQDGWKLVTVSELYEARGYELRKGVANRCAR